MKSLAKDLLVSSRAAACVGPKTRRPRRSSSSTRPRESGSSGPTTVRAGRSASTTRTMAARSPGLTGAPRTGRSPFWTRGCAMPAFPGAQTISVTRADLLNAQTIVCSRPPPPITRTLIAKSSPSSAHPRSCISFSSILCANSVQLTHSMPTCRARSGAADAWLRNHQAARRGQQDDRDEAFGLHLQRGVADGFEVGAGVVHEDDAVGVDLWEKSLDLGLADGQVGVGEEEVDGTVDAHLQAGLVAQLDPGAERRGFDARLGLGVDDGVELATDDAGAGAV